ncbi:hypothetical protein HID58_054115 [Brassica napus]|uniref:BnaC03g41510D protein n=3 Tax=Brassica TaxID=3705 RepID=A0A078HE25_BRANA|nr:uncharacterized protein BNAC03G41510D [Brassica napus]KAH0891686.1 hypothetical protein HID58_054115 [Brassica napus]CAF1705201.1 unnamed protein product [Brassica napus]CDY36047.1 BnaC03g41510D [Brassica napus]VDC94044.1 unnamed protein product [Brassica oleracea]
MADIDIGTAAGGVRGGRREPLINRENKFTRCVSHAQDELQSFRKYLRWMCVDQSSPWTAVMSWSMFVVFTLVVPATSHFVIACADCDSHHSRPYDSVVQLSLSSFASLSFLCLSRFVSKYGLRRFLFFDKLWHESETVRQGYTNQLNRSLKILSYFVTPCVLATSAYKIWWYASGASRIPFLGNVLLSDTVACLMEICSWLYRTTVIFLVCVLFRLICHLQILRLQDFAQVFQMDSDVGTILSEHLRIRRHLRIISHRFRTFILLSLILVTGSQFYSLLITTKAHAELNIYKTGELALCSVTLVTALLILLRSASKITHKAQAVTCLAAKWHVCATIESFETVEGGSPRLVDRESGHGFSSKDVDTGDTDDSEDYGDEEDDFDNNNLIPAYAYSTISFQKRQALVNYFENNKAGITVFGFTLDRSTLHTIFGIEMSLVLWLLGKTIGIS